MVVVFSEYLSPLWGFILLGWYVIISSPLGLSVAVIIVCTTCLLFPCWLFLLLTISVLWVYCVAVPCSWCPCCCSTLYKFITNPYKHTHELINVCYLLVVLLDVLTSNILLKYKRIIQNENRKRIFTKKKNTNKYCSFRDFRKFPFVWKKVSGGFETWPPFKKKGLPPCLDD